MTTSRTPSADARRVGSRRAFSRPDITMIDYTADTIQVEDVLHEEREQTEELLALIDDHADDSILEWLGRPEGVTHDRVASLIQSDKSSEDIVNSLLALVPGHELSRLRDAIFQGSLEACRDEVLIRESYFEDYAVDVFRDIHGVDSTHRWPFCHIDWEAAAADIRQDYNAVELNDTNYFVRA